MDIIPKQNKDNNIKDLKLKELKEQNAKKMRN